MKIQRFDVSNTPHLTITCHGDLELNGGREGEIAIKVYGGEQDLQVKREGERLEVTAHARCKIGCPQGTTVTLGVADGNLKIRDVDGPIAAERVDGDVVFKGVGPTTITKAGADVRARSVSGDLQVESVGGDFVVRDVKGSLKSDHVGGDLRASQLEGGLQATVGGDSLITTDLASGCDYQLTTGGDAVLKFPVTASAHFQVDAGGEIRHNVDWTELHQASQNTLTGRMGEADASAHFQVKAGGDVLLRSKSDAGAFVVNLALDDELNIELESMAEEIERTIQQQMARMSAQLEAQLGRIDDQAIRHKIEQAADKARRKAEHAAERARLKAERAQRRWDRLGGTSRTPRAPTAPRPPRQPAAPVSEEERMVVLKMVQEGKITPDEAARLLEAMEG